MITSGRPTCRLAPDGRCPPSCGVRSAALSLAIGVGSSLIAIVSGAPMPLPLRPGCFWRSRRASQEVTDSPSLNAPATGVGSSRKPGAGGGLCAEDEQAIAAVAGPGVGSAKAQPLRALPERGQVGEDPAEAPGAQRGDVFQEDVGGS